MSNLKNNSNVINLGCRLNSYESEVIEKILEKNKIKNVTVINTCAVTNQAVRKSKREIKKAKKNNLKNKIIVTGCASQIDPTAFLNMSEVERIIDNQLKTNEQLYKHNFTGLVDEVNGKLKRFPEAISNFNFKTRALLQIQQGCDHRCTFCIIPFGRGHSVSLPIGEIVKRTEKFLISGYKEIIITGVDITSYGNDLPGKPKLGEIIKRLLNILPDLKRLRLSSIDPAEIDKDLMDLIINEKRVLPHIHFSAQSGDDMILKRMKRRHSRRECSEVCSTIKKARSEITFGADIITGFPTETEENFYNTYKFIQECKFSNLHIFPFSPKLGTPAARMPQISNSIKSGRADKLRKLGNEIKLNYFKDKVGKTQSVLLEGQDLSYTDDYCKVKILEDKKKYHSDLRGQLTKVKFIGYDEDSIIAEIL